MVNYPTILGLPQEDIDRQLYVGVLGLESRVKALENKPKPTPTQSGTVSVTVTYNGNPQTGEEVILSTSDDLSDRSSMVAGGTTGDDGTCTLKTREDTEDIPFGNYYIFAVYDNTTDYTGSLTVDGDETVTITLTG